ncbi:aminoglycoside phosphotransferase family protein [Roseobacteraceae bacterium NS-SX3]
MELPPPGVLARFAISSPEPVAETAQARIWKVRRAGGTFAALKLYGPRGMGNEAQGFRFLAAAGGLAARVYAVAGRAALIEWLEGPPLADLPAAGGDRAAAAELLRIAQALHARPAGAAGYPRLEDWLAALFKLEFLPGCPDGARADIIRCQQLARRLLAEPQDLRPLHGDLHHGNIRKGARGYCAFDAKGVLGERAYELANAFRHPRGLPELVRSPGRIAFLADLWTGEFAVPRQRLLQWAAVKCALSIAWRCGGRLQEDREFDLLAALLAAGGSS